MKPGAPIDHFDARVAEDLEFDIVQAMLAELAGCPTSEKRAEELVPSKDRVWVIKRLQETDEMRRIRSEGNGFPLLEFEELKREIKLLSVRDSVLDEAGFRRISTASRIMNTVLESSPKATAPGPVWNRSSRAKSPTLNSSKPSMPCSTQKDTSKTTPLRSWRKSVGT